MKHKLLILLAVNAILFVAYRTLVNPISGVAFSSSMEPTVRVGDVVFVNAQAYKTSELQRGDFIHFRHEIDGVGEEPAGKRIIGLSGDTVTLKSGVLNLNGERITQRVVKNTDAELITEERLGSITYHARYDRTRDTNPVATLRDGSWVVPDGHVFVLGDNRDHSADSRHPRFGMVAEESITGRMEFIVWNLNKVKELKLHRHMCSVYQAPAEGQDCHEHEGSLLGAIGSSISARFQ